VQALALIGEIVTFVLGLWGSIALALATGPRDSNTGIRIVVGLILAFLLSIVLAFLEYAVARRSNRFRADLRGSLWLNPLGGTTRF
jgi:hypothetical protein